MMRSASPFFVRTVSLSMGLADTRDAWRVRELADALAEQYTLRVEVRASDHGVVIRVSRVAGSR
jgi:hypothetical protein